MLTGYHVLTAINRPVGIRFLCPPRLISGSEMLVRLDTALNGKRQILPAFNHPPENAIILISTKHSGFSFGSLFDTHPSVTS